MYQLPKLPYAYDSLSRSISQSIMQLHHTKHHQAYVDKLNQALEENSHLKDVPLSDLLARNDLPIAVRNHGGGHYNHSLFWQCMDPAGGGSPKHQLADAIEQKYGSLQQFVDEFSQRANNVFGSGWTWLLPNMEIVNTPNQDTPMLLGLPEPILGLDVWEHAYYLDYKNVRADYIDTWWDVVNWEFVGERYKIGLKLDPNK